MEFDVTNLDRKILLRALFAYSSPKGLGNIEYTFRESQNENVEGLSDIECEEILYELEKMKSGTIRVLDYHKGKPMKLDFKKKDNGQIKISTTAYDQRNGKYRFFEAILDTFLEEEIIITKKGYGGITSFPKIELSRSKEQVKLLKSILSNSVLSENKNGRYWKIDSSKKEYKSPSIQLFEEQ
ncbi:hypothetical protein [Tenacibaculum amylolyticum]|uniref:hypothetical protein n=1 Tax=Tenacibaculum amylolyticum TaxID=104269 RepID=UPI00389482D9